MIIIIIIIIINKNNDDDHDNNYSKNVGSKDKNSGNHYTEER